MLKPRTSFLQYYITYIGMGFQMVTVMAISMWVGIKLDQYVAWRFPFFLTVFSMGATILVMYLTIKKLLHKVDNQQPN